MSTSTTKLHLPKPDAIDYFNRTSYNALVDAIEANAIGQVEKAAANGVATLGSDIKIPLAQIPSVLTGKDADTLDGKHATDLAPIAHVGSSGAAHAAVTTSVNGFMLATDKVKLDGIATGAEVNQNAFSNVLVGGTTVAADGKTDTLELAAGSGVTLTPDATNDKVTFAVAMDDSVHGTRSGGNLHAVATTSTNGFLGSGDKAKIDVLRQNISATLPATAGWYRVATSAVGIGRNQGTFRIDWTIAGNQGSVILNAANMYGTAQSALLDQVSYSQFAAGKGLTKARLVYHTTYTGNYAYLEVYNETAEAITVNVNLYDTLGWSLVTPSTAGSIPGGYSNVELAFNDGLATSGQITSRIATGIAPLDVSSTTVVTNLNADMLDGIHATSFVQGTRNVNTGNGLTGGGNLTADRTISVDYGGNGSATTVARSDHSHTIAGASITDVTVSSPTTGQVLRYNGTVWANSGQVFDELTDVVITAPAVGEVLGHDGTKWINKTLAEAGILSDTGNAASASTAAKLTTPRTFSATGDATGSLTFDGTANVSMALTLANSGATAGTYRSVTVDIKGRVTGGTNPTTLAGYGITDAAPSSHIGAGGTAHANVTTTVDGFMSAADKVKLNGIATGATNYTHPATHPATMITEDTTHRWVTDAEKVKWNNTMVAVPNKIDMQDTSGNVNTIVTIKDGDANGVGVAFGGRGKTIIGAGESHTSLLADATYGVPEESMVVSADVDVYLLSNIQTGVASKHEFKFDKSGNVLVDGTYLNSLGGNLWSGSYYMNDTQTITPSVPIANCPNGWALVWSDADAGTAQDFDWVVTFMHKNQVSNSAQLHIVPNNQTSTAVGYTVKSMKFTATQILGHANNDQTTNGGNDVVLRRVLMW